jgi:hypothetical protein
MVNAINGDSHTFRGQPQHHRFVTTNRRARRRAAGGTRKRPHRRGTGRGWLRQFGWIHEIACPSENVLFVADVLNWRGQKLILHPQAAK